MIKASVVVPVYNGERTLKRCLEALLELDYPKDSYEIIVVDNNSNDQTVQIATRFPIKLLHEKHIQTSYAARNKGILEAVGDIVAFTDADCIAAPNWLHELLLPFDDSSIGGVGGQVIASGPEGDVEKFITSLQLFSQYQDSNYFLPYLITCNAAYRRKNLIELGGFNARLFTSSDIDLAWRLQLNTGCRLVFNSNAKVSHIHRSTLSSMSKQFKRSGFGEIFLDTMYKNQPGYQRTLSRQLAHMLRQSWSMMVYMRSIIYRGLSWKFQKKDRLYALTPYFSIIAEASNLWGKVQGLWATRLMNKSPLENLWADPGER